MSSHSIPLRFISILQSWLRLCPPCRFFPSDVFTFYRLTCRVHLNLLVLITLIIFGEKQGTAGLDGTLAVTAIDKARRNHLSRCTLRWLVQTGVREVRFICNLWVKCGFKVSLFELGIFFTLSLSLNTPSFNTSYVRIRQVSAVVILRRSLLFFYLSCYTKRLLLTNYLCVLLTGV
jgi:hypothetical protein